MTLDPPPLDRESLVFPTPSHPTEAQQMYRSWEEVLQRGLML